MKTENNSGAFIEKEYIDILVKNYWGEYFGWIWYRWLERLFFDSKLKSLFKELAARERELKLLIKGELANHDVEVKEGKFVFALFAFVLALLSFLLPKALFLRLSIGQFERFISILKQQEARFGAENPGLFRRLVEHEVYQYEQFSKLRESMG